MTLLPLRGASSRARRSAEAIAPGPETKWIARRARACCRSCHSSGSRGCGQAAGWNRRGGGAGGGVVVGVGDQGDHLADDGPVRAAGDDRDDEGVAGDRLRVGPGQVPVLAGPGAEPGVLDDGRPVHVEEVPERDGHIHAGVGSRPVRDHLGADEELAGLLEGVVVALLGGPQVLRAAALAERVDHRGEGGGALGGQVAPQVPGVVEGGVEDEGPVAEPAPGRVLLRVGLLRPPRLVGGLGQQLQVIEVRARGGGVDEDLVGRGLELVGVDPAGPGGDLPRPRDRDRRRWRSRRRAMGGGPGGASGGRRPWRPCRRGGFSSQPLGGGGVAVGVVVVGGVEPPHQPVGGRAEQRGDRTELLQRLGPAGAVETGRGRGVQVRAEVAADPERVGDAGEAPAGGGQGASGPVWRAHHEPPPSAGLRGGWCAGAATAVRLLRPTHAGCLPPLQITRSINDYQIDLA